MVASTFLLLCKESSGLFLVPAYIMLCLDGLTSQPLLKQLREKVIFLFPWIILLVWKLIIQSLYPEVLVGFTALFKWHFNWPLKGIYDSLNGDFFIAEPFLMVWGFILIALCLKELWQRKKPAIKNWMYWGVWINLLLVLCYAVPIYTDMWSFMRVLAASHMLCFFFLLERKVKLPKWFLGYSVLCALFAVAVVVLVQ